MNKKSEWYESRRNELLDLLSRAQALDIPDKYSRELSEIATKCRENAFEIALVGEFQGGKSTTFNALCDGRDISPRGLGGGGIKTSATVISAQNIADDETKDGLNEWAEVTFRRPQDLALGMFDLLHLPLLENREFRQLFPEKSDEEYKKGMLVNVSFAHDMLNIDDVRQHDILLTVLQTMWKKWQDNKASFSDDTLDQLRIATLQVTFHGTQEYHQLTQETVLPIDRFQKLVAFPKDWEKRWADGENASFTIDEIGFVFVDSVLVRLHSKNLERIGCRITDCPGLFVNAYDTYIAEKTIAKADGIWYLMNGEKQIGEKDMKIIRKIFSMSMADKLSVTGNLRGPQKQRIDEILPATKSILSNVGLDVDVFPYNARLAFLAMQGNLLLQCSENVSPRDLECMRIDSRDKTGASPATMWVKMLKRLGCTTEIEELEDIDALDDDAVQLVRDHSFLDDMLDRVEKNVITKKSRSILVDKGSHCAASALQGYEGELNIKIESARQTEEDWKKKRDAAKVQLNNFVESATKIVKKSLIVKYRETFTKEMARESVSLLLTEEFIDALTRDVCVVLAEVSEKYYLNNKKMTEDFEYHLIPKLTEELRIGYMRAMMAWRVAQNGSFVELKQCVEAICDDIHTVWKERSLSSDPILRGLPLPRILQEDISGIGINLSTGVCDENSGISKIAEDIRYGMLSMIFHIVLNILMSPINLLYWGVKKILGDIVDSMYCEMKFMQKVQKLIPKVKPEMKKIFDCVKIRCALQQPFENKFESIQEDLAKKIIDDLGKLSDELVARCADASQESVRSQEERCRLADKCARIRNTQIQPLRELIQKFEQETLAEL